MAEFGDADAMLVREGNTNEDDGNTTGHFTFNPYYNSTPGPYNNE